MQLIQYAVTRIVGVFGHHFGQLVTINPALIHDGFLIIFWL